MGIYDQIFDKAINMAKENLHNCEISKRKYLSSIPEALSINEFIADAEQLIASKGISSESDEFHAAYAAFGTLNAMNNLCVAHEVCDSVEKIFSNEKQWLSKNGVAPNNLEAVKNYVFDKALGIDEKSQAQLEVINTLNTLMDSKKAKSSSGRRGMIQDSFEYADGIIKSLTKGIGAIDAIAHPDMNKLLSDDNFKDTIQLATGVYAAKTSPNQNTHDVNSLAGVFLNGELEEQAVPVNIQYDVQDGISPREFLKRYSEGTTTDADKAWANQVLNEMVYGALGKIAGDTGVDSNALKDNQISVTDFMVGLDPIVTKEEYNRELEKASQEYKDKKDAPTVDLGYRVVASLLRGDQVSVIRKDSDKVINFAPQIKLSKERSGIMGLIDSILEFFASLFHETDKSFVKAMNAVYDKNNEAAQGKNQVTFNELEDEDRTATNRARPRNTNAVENELDDSIVPITHTK